MADNGLMNFNVTAVAIDKDRNSQHAVRWALDHLLVNSPFALLIHVINKSHNQSKASFLIFSVKIQPRTVLEFWSSSVPIFSLCIH